MTDTPQAESYNTLSKALHWLVALLVLSLLGMGFFMGSMDFSPLKLQIYSLHKSFGLTVLWLVALRLVWRAATKTPPAIDTHAKWEKYLSKFIHGLLYAGLLIMPISGLVMSSAGEFPINYFGLFEMPAISAKDETLFKLMREVHEIGAYCLYLSIGLHFLGAAKHHVIDKDSTLRRMGGSVIFLIFGALFLMGIGTLIAQDTIFKAPKDKPAQEQQAALDESTQSAPQTTPEWIIDKEQSHLHFTFQQYNKPIQGSFEGFQGSINFDPDAVENSKARIEIDIASIKTGSDDRDNQAKSSEWFDTQQFPKAIFETESFTKTGDDSYIADGNLTIRDTTLPISLPFTLTISDDGKTSFMNSEITLERLDFGVGQGQWKTEEAIDNTVKITIKVQARR